MLSMKNLGSLNPSDFKLVPTPNTVFKLVPKPNMLFPLQFFRLVAILQMLESIILNFGEEMQRLVKWTSVSGNIGLRILWLFLHLAVSIWFFLVGIVQYFESFLIASDILNKYEALDISKVRYLAVVIDSEGAQQISKVFELLEWLVDIGVRNVCLYDPDGVLKKYKEAITDRFSSAKVSEEASNGPVVTDRNLTLEFVSFSVGKEAVAKAANYLFTKHYANGNKEKTEFTEPQMGEALAAIGSGGFEPDLLLIYEPIRCHLGFPAWRLRYTEIVQTYGDIEVNEIRCAGESHSQVYYGSAKLWFMTNLIPEGYLLVEQATWTRLNERRLVMA